MERMMKDFMLATIVLTAMGVNALALVLFLYRHDADGLLYVNVFGTALIGWIAHAGKEIFK
jgi:uncharacterized membrane protein